MVCLHKECEFDIGTEISMMNNINVPHRVQQWLDDATHRLPSEMRESIREELMTHYELAFEEKYLACKDEILAHQYAMQALGDSGLVDSEFQSIYDYRHYLLAIFGLGMGIIMWIVAKTVWMPHIIRFVPIVFLIEVGVGIYFLQQLGRYLASELLFRNFEASIGHIKLVLIAYMLSGVLYRAIWYFEPQLFDTGVAGSMSQIVYSTFGIATGSVLTMFGIQLFQQRTDQQFLQSVAFFLSLAGIAVLVQHFLLVFVPSFTAYFWFIFVLDVSILSTWGMGILLFLETWLSKRQSLSRST